MAITCQNCGYDQNPPGSEFCEACGSELGTVESNLPESNSQETIKSDIDEIPTIVLPPEDSTVVLPPEEPTVVLPPEVPTIVPLPEDTEISPPTANPSISPSTARLISKLPNVPTPEFNLDGSNAIVGRFDTDSGPVDIDLEGFPGEDTVSRAHAEIYYETGEWKTKDIGSTNGVFIKPVGESRFGARITIPETLNSGDEIAFGKIRFLFQCP